MVWFKVDDQLAVHLKTITAGNAAMGLWVRAGSWCAAQLTDGVVPAAMVATLGGSTGDAQALVDAGLWHEQDGGYAFHDWAEYQPTREQVLADRAAAQERMRNVRANRKANVRPNARDLFGDGSASPSPVPSPDYSKTSKSQSSSKHARVSTDAIEVSEMTRRLAAQQGITSLRTVMDAIHRHTSATVTADQAFQVAVWILGKAKNPPAAPQRYVTGSIAKSPAEVEQHIFEAVA